MIIDIQCGIRRQLIRTALGLIALITAGAALAAPQLQIAPLSYQVLQVQQAPGQARPTFDVTARVGILNSGDPAKNVTASLASSSADVLVLDGLVGFGDVAKSRSRVVFSRDSFSLRIVIPATVNSRKISQVLQFVGSVLKSLSWTISCANCGQTAPPVANAGPDQTAYVDQTVSLDGAASTDASGAALTYQWSFVSRPAGSVAALSDAAAVRPSFVLDRSGTYVVQLIVRNGTTASAPDTVSITTLNSPPVANAGPDQSVFVGDLVTLNGTGSTDVDGNPLNYTWNVLSSPAGSSAALSSELVANPTFRPDIAGQYTFELTVYDGAAFSVPDTVVITTRPVNTPPVAKAGPDQTVAVGGVAQLDGSASSDADPGDTLTFAWVLLSRPPGSTASLGSFTGPQSSFVLDVRGTYVAQLTVSDGQATSTDTVVISTLNSPPLADAGSAQAVRTGVLVQLNGSGSSDPDNDALSFSWSLAAVPDGSATQLSDAHVINPTFTADSTGLFTAQLIVNDGQVDSAPVTVNIQANNAAPVANSDTASTAANASVLISVLANDTDSDKDTLSITSVTAALHGSVVIQAAAVSYTPAAGYTGQDSFTYSISDGHTGVATGAVNVTVTAVDSNAPTAVLDVSPNPANIGSAVTLSGIRSFDAAPGKVATYTFTLISAPAGYVANAGLSVDTPLESATGSLTFVPNASGAYVVQLVVADDSANLSAPVRQTVSTVNRPPIANAGPDQSGLVGDAIVLDGSSSVDPDGQSLSYGWSLVSGPASAQLANQATVNPTLTATQSGTYVVELVVNDGIDASLPDQVVVVINPVAASPTATLAPRATALTAFAGSSVFLDFDVTYSGNFAGIVAIQGTNLPAGVAVTGLDLPGGTAQGSIEISVDPSVATGIVPVELTVSDGAHTQVIPLTLDVGPPEVSAQQKIREALAAGLIDLPTSLLYRAYAFADDPRLPAAYRGSGSAAEDFGLSQEIAEILPTLAPDIAAPLEPFTRRPTDPAGWYANLRNAAAGLANRGSATAKPNFKLSMPAIASAQAAVFPSTCPDPFSSITWISKRSALHPVRVWVECTQANSTDASSQIDKVLGAYDAIWNSMTADMGDPPPDNQIVHASDVGDGDDAIDVYIIGAASKTVRNPNGFSAFSQARGTTYAWDIATVNPVRSSAYTVIPLQRVFTSYLVPLAIHEFFHVLQYANANPLKLYQPPATPQNPRPAKQTWWFYEASAEWAQAHYDRTIGNLPGGRQAGYYVYEQEFRKLFLNRPADEPLNDQTPEKPYEAFIWPYFIEQQSNGAAPIFDAWKALGGVGNKDVNQADATLDGKFSFATNFEEFAVRGLNLQLLPGDPLKQSDRFVALDPAEFNKSDNKPHRRRTEHQLLHAGDAFSYDLKVAKLGAEYGYFQVTDPGIRRVAFQVSEALGAGLVVDAFVKIVGKDWERRHVTKDQDLMFCFDNPLQQLEMLHLIVSNTARGASGDPATQSSVQISASPKACPFWFGNVSGTQVLNNPVAGTTRVDTVAGVLLDFDENSPAQYFNFRLASGSFSYRSESNASCTTISKASGQLSPPNPVNPTLDGTAVGGMAIFPGGYPLAPNTGAPQYVPDSQNLILFATLDVQSNCSGQDTVYQQPTSSLPWWILPGPIAFDLPANGKIVDRYTFSNPTGSYDFNWTLTRFPAP